jgi:hypothetical protein
MEEADIKVRMAQDSEASIVAGLVKPHFQFVGWDLKFETVFPYWLVAEVAGEIVGTINIRISVPISTAEMLVVKPGFERDERRMIALLLADSATVICLEHGAEAMSAMVFDEMGSFVDYCKENGGMVGGHGSILFRRVR